MATPIKNKKMNLFQLVANGKKISGYILLASRRKEIYKIT